MHPTDPQSHSSTLYQKVVEALSTETFYPHDVSEIEIIETHISVIFLTGDFAYKLKKPVNFGFLNFTDPQQRLKFCAKELTLNQRTAKSLYLDVKPLYLNQGEVSWQVDPEEHPKKSAIDCVVRMRQFDPKMVLGNYLANPASQSLSTIQIHGLAQQIAALHSGAEKASEEERFGRPETLLKPMMDNFPSLKKFFGSNPSLSAHLSALIQVENWTLKTYQRLEPILHARKTHGFVRSCHGDLHLDNIALINDQPTIFDAIEFNDDFSHIDVISDLAFLLIDLQKRGATTLAKQILSIYLHFTQDYHALKLLPFYQVYRAMVRAKISALQAQQKPDDSEARQELTNKTVDYLQLAQSLQRINPNPKLLLVQGISGSGKSIFANQLLQQVLKQMNVITISSDRTRKQLFGVQPHERLEIKQKQELYSQAMSQKTYQTLLNNAQLALDAGISVIVDATFLKKLHRQKFYDMAKAQGIDYYLFFIDISPQLAQQSIIKRQSHNQDPSDADVGVMLNQVKFLEKPTADEPSLTLHAEKLRHKFPTNQIKSFLNRSLI